MSKPGDRKMDRSQLPLLRKKKTSKEVASKDKDATSTKKDEAKAFQTKPGAVTSTGCQATSSASLPREEGSPGGRKDLGSKPKNDDRVPINGDGIDLVVEEEGDGRKPRTPIDWEWSKYVVRGGQPSEAYQKFGPEKSVPAEDIQGKAKQVQRRVTGLAPPKLQYSQLPHLTGQQYFSGKLNSPGDYSPTDLHLQEDSRLHSATNGKSSHPQVFTFDQKHFDDHDSSPIYHELDPLGVYNPSAHHTYQSITEIKEEVNRLQAEAARGPVAVQSNNSGPTQSATQTASGPTRSTIKPDSGTVRSTALDSSPKRRSSKTLPSHLTRVCAPRSPTLLPSPSSPTVPGHQGPTRAQSIFSKLWLQKKPAAQVPKDSPTRNGDYASSSSNSATTRNLSLGDVRLDSPNTEKNFSALYALTSPPPSAATAMSDYYQRLAGNQGVATSPLSPTSAYGMAACKNLLNFYGNSKRSLSDSTAAASHSLGDRGKAGGKSGVAYENRLPWRNCRELSPMNGKSSADRWDIVRFGEPLDSPVSGGGNVSLETFKSKKSSPKPSKVCSSSPCYQCPAKPQSSASSSKKDCSPVAKKSQQKGSKRTEETNGRAREIDRFPERQFPLSRTMTNMSSLSKSQENVVLSAFPLDLFTTSPPGSFESLLSEDDVFLPSSNERLNLLSPPLPRTTFSSPSCGVRMAELRAVRRKSDSKSPSPEPPAVSTPPPYLPFFQISSPTHRPEPVTKQDVAVQTSPIRSPVRLGGKNSHRYMHTIIEEDHFDQGHCPTDGKQPGVRFADSKTKTIAPDSSRDGNASVHGRGLSVFQRREMDEFGKEEEEEEEDTEAPSSGNLLEIISEADDDDNSSLDSSSGKIRLSSISCSAGNLRDGDDDGVCTRAAAADDSAGMTRPPSDSPQPVQNCSSNELASVSDLERSSQMSGVSAAAAAADSDRDCRRSAGSKSMSATSEAESIASVQDVEPSISTRPGCESGRRPKGSKLRPPKPAKCIATRITDGQSGAASVANQQREDVSELPRYSAQYVKAKVSETRPLTSAPKQFSDTQPSVAVDSTRTQPPIIKEAAVRCIECIGTNSHDNKATTAASVDTKSCDQQAAPEVPRTAPTVPLKSGRGPSHEKSPIAQRTRIPAEPKKNFASSKSHPSISSASGVRNKIDGAPSETNPDCSSSSGSQSGSQSLPSKGDSALTNRNSSLSSSLTSSSSSSLFSIADSESENVARSRKDPLISVTRPGEFKSSPPADGVDRTSNGKTSKPGLNDGKGLEKSRLAVPKVSVTRF